MFDGLQTVGRNNLWGQPLYATCLEEVDPYHDLHRFRSLNQAYDGNNTYWSIPSPEPNLSEAFWEQVLSQLEDEALQQAGQALAATIAEWEPNFEKLIFISILRAGVPIAAWLTQLLPGSNAVAMSLFVGLGIDTVALQTLQQNYPTHRIVFVDGWTGRGGVARLLQELAIAPLAVLIDPWGWADFAGVYDDIFCPTACFTGPTTLGFSRTFFTSSEEMFATYLFPTQYNRPNLIAEWQRCCPAQPTTPSQKGEQFYKETTLRLHSNEVCRSLINANPAQLYMVDDKATAQRRYSLLLSMAEQRKVPVTFKAGWLNEYKTNVAAELMAFQTKKHG